jgi:hypothetical protein
MRNIAITLVAIISLIILIITLNEQPFSIFAQELRSDQNQLQDLLSKV